VIRSFAYEANLPAGFKVELDVERVLSQAVDELLRELELKGNEELKGWLIKHTLSKIEEGKDWNIASELNTLGKEVFKEEFQSLDTEVLNKLRDKKLLDNYRKQLTGITSAFEKTIKELSAQGLELMKQYALNDDMLHLKSRSPLKKLQKLQDVSKTIDYLEIAKLLPLIDNPEVCFNKKNSESDNGVIIDCFNGGLNKVLVGLTEQLEKNRTLYFTSKSILSNLNALGITTDIALKVNELIRNENLFLLADANRLLNQIIDENDAPFIYEKTGTRFMHYMIDEFQDTSRLQWGNFRPLLQNSLSDNNNALIVGDVKQSIYRWRNSDWKLLSDQVSYDFRYLGVENKTLDTNWRSSENVITFNNIVFSEGARMLQNEFIKSSEEANADHPIPEDLVNKITNAYDDTIQQISPKSIGTKGLVQVDFVEGKTQADFRENATKKAVEQVESLLAKGLDYKDICILVRRKSEGQEITEALLSGQFSGTGSKHPVISNETLLLGSSPAVNMVIQQIKYIQDPDNPVYQGFINLYSPFYETYKSDTNCEASPLLELDPVKAEQYSNDLLLLKGQPLFEMTESLVRQLPEELYSIQFVFLQGLLDTVRSYVTDYSVNVHDFIEWWDNKGQNTSISVPEGQNAINVMTIHKSKGLEFNAVLIPYCNWPVDDRGHGSLIWCQSKEEPFNQLELLPVSYSTQLLHTLFVDDYLNEKLHQYVDNLNLLYVAFTRAKNSLGIIAEAPPAKNNGIKNVSHLLFRLLNELNMVSDLDEALKSQLEEAWDQEQMSYQFGELPPIEKQSQPDEKPAEEPFRTTALGERLKIHPESQILNTPDGLKHLKHGKLMHRLFELIVYAEDVDRAITQLILNGQLKTSEKEAVSSFVKRKMEQTEVKAWFDPKATIINEGDILMASGSFRPDRVIIRPDKVTVVDYKFGEQKSEKHQMQVQQYIRLLNRMGYNNVEGYLWYMHLKDDIVKVNTQPIQGTLF
jgi:ATP-dependent exoDNAse (exonuclease V) beta subunit